MTDFSHGTADKASKGASADRPGGYARGTEVILGAERGTGCELSSLLAR